jgi:hypothetical protein
MADDAFEERIEALAEELGGAYMNIVRACLLLPLPVRLPLPSEVKDRAMLPVALHRAAEAIADLPLHRVDASLLRQSMYWWIAARVMGAAYKADPAEHNFAVAADLAEAAGAGAQVVMMRLITDQD